MEVVAVAAMVVVVAGSGHRYSILLATSERGGLTVLCLLA